MNEFTKDQLYIMLKCVRLCEIDHGECSDLDNVKFKLLSVIDNYCEHEWENICCQCTLDKIYCHKCERRINDNQ